MLPAFISCVQIGKTVHLTLQYCLCEHHESCDQAICSMPKQHAAIWCKTHRCGFCASGAHDEPSVSNHSRHSAWQHSRQHQADGEVQSLYRDDDPFAGEEGVSSTSRASINDLGFASGPRCDDGGRQRAISAPKDRPNLRATVPRCALYVCQ